MSYDEPHKIGSDLDLFDDHPPRPAPPQPSPEKAQLVIGLLRGAGLKPPFGMDQDDADLVWGAKLAPFDTMTLHDAANDWIDNNSDFPSVMDIVSNALRIRNRSRAIKNANDNPIPGATCMQCQGVGFIDDDETAVIGTGHPCPACMPDQYKLWSGGHFMKAHQEMGGCAECKNR